MRCQSLRAHRSGRTTQFCHFPGQDLASIRQTFGHLTMTMDAGSLVRGWTHHAIHACALHACPATMIPIGHGIFASPCSQNKVKPAAGSYSVGPKHDSPAAVTVPELRSGHEVGETLPPEETNRLPVTIKQTFPGATRLRKDASVRFSSVAVPRGGVEQP